MLRQKKKHAANHERWLVSYADLLTLLFAFFVVMFASTQSDHENAKKISEAVDKALQGGSFAAIVNKAEGKPPGKASVGENAESQKSKSATAPNLSATFRALQAQLNDEVERRAVSLHMEHRGIVIGLSAQVVFPSGGDTIAVSAYPIIAKVAGILSALPNALRLEGHTDSLPISNERFRSNWELSAARSIAMLRLLQERYSIDQNRMAVVGYAATNAVGDNQTETGRTQNRRVDIVIVSEFGMNSEPGKTLSH